MLRWAIGLGSIGLLLAAPALADKFILGIDQEFIGQSNLFKTPTNEISDGTYDISPVFQFVRPEGRFNYDVQYTPSYEVYFRTPDVNRLDHFLRSRFEYQVLPVGALHLRLDVANYNSLRGVGAVGAGGIPDVVPGISGTVTRIFADLDYEHRITRTTTAVGSIGLERYGFTTPNNVDTLGLGGEIEVTHEPWSNLAFGGSLLASHRKFDEQGTQPESENIVINPNVLIRSWPTSRISFDLSVGPAFIFTRQAPGSAITTDRFSGFESDNGTFAEVFDTVSPDPCQVANGQPVLGGCPLAPADALSGRLDEQVSVDYDPDQRPPGVEADLVTFFLAAALRRDASWGHTRLDYTRTEDGSAGNGGTTIRDSVTAEVLFLPDNDWTLRLRANWNRRESTSSIDRTAIRAGPSSVPTGTGLFFAEANGLIPDALRTQSEITQYWVDLTANREIWERLTLELRFRYLRQDRTETATAARNFDNYLGAILFSYRFAPLEY